MPRRPMGSKQKQPLLLLYAAITVNFYTHTAIQDKMPKLNACEATARQPTALSALASPPLQSQKSAFP